MCIGKEFDRGADTCAYPFCFNKVIAAEELCKAIEAKDYAGAAAALRAAFELLESEPHHEGEHI